MDAKQACDKLNGFNFQSRYLVGMTILPLSVPDLCESQKLALTRTTSSSLPPARKDGQVKRGPRCPPRKFSSVEETTRYRLTIRPACRQPAKGEAIFPVCRPVSILYEGRAVGIKDNTAKESAPVWRSLGRPFASSRGSFR
jgi:hypothetical protein